MSSNVPDDSPGVGSPTHGHDAAASTQAGRAGAARAGCGGLAGPAPSGPVTTLIALLDDVVAAEAALASAEVARMRALAAAGRFALDAASSARPSVRASDMAMREVASEIAAACRTSDRTVQREIDEALTLVESFPTTVTAWAAGALSRRHVRVIADIGVELPREVRGEYDGFAAALGEQLSPGRLKNRLTVAAQRLHPTTLTERHRAGRDQRAVRVIARENGMSDLIATLPTVLAEAVVDRLTQQAQVILDASPTAAGTPSDARTMDHVRADILADLLLTSDPTIDPTRAEDGPGTLGKIRARVQVVVPALTMLRPGRENRLPAELVGHGPIDADTARTLAEATSVPWDRVITHPITGAVLHADTYSRPRAIDRYVRARDRHCRWPGCTAPAIRCEIDHSVDWALGGSTDVRNLCCLCQRHHTQKQFTRWSVRQLDAGVLEWTSPTGRVYIDTPGAYPTAEEFAGAPPGVRFQPDDASPPPPSTARQVLIDAAPF